MFAKCIISIKYTLVNSEHAFEIEIEKSLDTLTVSLGF